MTEALTLLRMTDALTLLRMTDTLTLLRTTLVLNGLVASMAVAQATPERFAPGQLAGDSAASFGSMSPNGREFYYTIHRPDFSAHRIVVSKLDGASWSHGTTLPFSGVYNDREPRLSPDGRRLYFSSNRPTTSGDTARRRDQDLWMSSRVPNGEWQTPRHVDAPINTSAQEFSPVVTSNGTLYFIATRPGGIGGPANPHNVWRARPTDTTGLHFGAPENLGPAINTGLETNVFVSWDDRLMFVSRDGAPGGLGGDDIYTATSFGGVWQPMRHLPAPINSEKYDYGPALSSNGKWLFLTSWRSGTSAIYRIPIAEIEREGVKRAALDYLEGFYEGDSAKLSRSLRRDLFKYGIYRQRDSTKFLGEHMSYDDAIAYANNFKAKKSTTAASAPREIAILEVLNETAVVKVTAWWGTDYLLLGKFDGRWMISSAIWQDP